MKPTYKFGENLNRIMMVLGMSQSELAQRTGLKPSAVSQLCRGLRDPSLHSIVRILDVLPVKFEALVSMSEKKARKS